MIAQRMPHIGHLPRCDCHDLKTLSGMAGQTCAVAYCVRGLTFELRGSQRRGALAMRRKIGAKPQRRMASVPRRWSSP